MPGRGRARLTLNPIRHTVRDPDKVYRAAAPGTGSPCPLGSAFTTAGGTWRGLRSNLDIDALLHDTAPRA
jgi:hypothetical protein